MRPGKLKTKAVKEYPVPKTLRQLRNYLSLTGYFRKFVKNYALIGKALSDMLKKDAHLRIGSKQLEAIELLKKAFISQPVLKIYDPNRETQLHIDASAHDYGGILMQMHEDGNFHPLHYASTKVTTQE